MSVKMMIALKRFLSVFITLAITGIRASDQECGQQELSRCARPLQVLTDTSELNFVSKKEELDLLCPDLFQGLRCINSYTRRCMSPEQRGHFGRLYRGTGAAVAELCSEGPYQQRFLRHAPCLRGLKPQYERCAAAYQAAVGALNSNTNSNASHHSGDKLKTLCCSFQAYMACSERAVLVQCGEDSAGFTRDFLHRMGDTLIKMHCSDYPEGSDHCAEFMGYSSSSSAVPSYLTIFLPVLLLSAALLQSATSSRTLRW